MLLVCKQLAILHTVIFC